MIDFDQLVLAPNVDVIFGIQCQFTLTVSNPGAPPVLARGVFSSGPLDVQMEDEVIFSDQETSLGIRARDFAVLPDRGDTVENVEPTHPGFGTKYWIGDTDWDGQGGFKLLLRVQEPLG
jgi:hypothetical protein